MFGKPPSSATTKLDAAIIRILDEMDTFGPDSPEYPEMLASLERMNAVRKSQDKWRVNPDNLALVAGNLLGILVIVAYEQKHVMTSKGLGFILRSK